MRVRTKTRLPANQLLDLIEERGGLWPVLRLAGIRTQGDNGKDSPEVKRYKKYLAATRERGWVDLFWTDAFIVKVLKMHPIEVYGFDWLSIPEDDELQEALATGSAA